MNLVIETKEPGFVENDWVGRELRVGETARLKITMSDPRCVMTTLAQEELPRDANVLRTLARHNRVRIGDGKLPCAGVYAEVSTSGAVALGDSVVLT